MNKLQRELMEANRRTESARRSAAREREKSELLGIIAGAGPVAGGVAAASVLPMLPGPTEAKLQELAAKRKGPASSKRVQVCLGLTAGAIILGRGIIGRTLAAAMGGVTAAAWATTRVKMDGAGALNALTVGES